ncbi:MAG: hypothetical protein HYY17_04120 [Planctomycetes bacterium]|nr:hypothetical protein [Planctomycetota bacterium]
MYVTLIDLAEDEAHRRHVLMFATSRLRAHDAAERVQAAKLFAMVSGDSEFLSRWVADEVRAAVAGIEGVNLSNVLAAARFSNGTLERVTSRSVDADGVIHTDRRETLRYAGCVSVVIRRSPSAPGVLDRIRRLAAIRAGIDPESVTVVEVPR